MADDVTDVDAQETSPDPEALTEEELAVAEELGKGLDKIIDEENTAVDDPADEAAEGEDEEGSKDTDEPTEPELTGRQINAAKSYRIDEDAIKALGESAPSILDRLADANSDIGRRYSKLGRAEKSDPSKGSDEPGEFEPIKEFDPAEDEYLATAINPLVGIVNKLGERLGQVGTRADAAFARSEEEQMRRAEGQADGYFESVREDFPQFGDGPTGELGEHTPEHRARQELIEEAAALRKGYELVHDRKMSVRESLDRALNGIGMDAKVKAERARLRKGVNSRSRQITSRPTNRKGGDRLTPDQKAERSLGIKMKKLGLTD